MNASLLLSVTTVGLETILVPLVVLSALRMRLKSEAENTAVATRPVLVAFVTELSRLNAPLAPLVVVSVVPLVEFVWVLGVVLTEFVWVLGVVLVVVVPFEAIGTT